MFCSLRVRIVNHIFFTYFQIFQATSKNHWLIYKLHEYPTERNLLKYLSPIDISSGEMQVDCSRDMWEPSWKKSSASKTLHVNWSSENPIMMTNKNVWMCRKWIVKGIWQINFYKHNLIDPLWICNSCHYDFSITCIKLPT